MVLELNDANYSEFIEKTNDIVFIDFYSPTCGPCVELLPLLDRMSEHYKEQPVTISKVNVAYNPKLSAKYNIRSVPFCIVIGKDKMVKEAEVGLSGPNRYFSMIDSAIGKKSFLAKLFGRFFS